MFFVKFHEDFTSIEIIGKYEFIIFDINYLEINTIYEVGLICAVLPFNDDVITKNNDNYYNYMSIILYENENFYLKIYSYLNDNIREIEKLNLVEYPTEFEVLIDDNRI